MEPSVCDRIIFAVWHLVTPGILILLAVVGFVHRLSLYALVEIRLHGYRYCAIAQPGLRPYDGVQLPPV